MTEIKNVQLADIFPAPNNPRKKIEPSELAELAESIKAVGILQPITVRHQFVTLDDVPVADDYYEIVCGHRRYEAAKLAGLTEIPCIVRNLSDEEAFEVMITENLQRKDVDPFDEAEAFLALQKRGYDTDSLASKFGKSNTYILSRLKLNSLIPEFRQKYVEGVCEYSHCNIIARMTPEAQKSLLSRYKGDRKWDDLSGAPVATLKNVIASGLLSLSSAMFDTSACASCLNNTACSQLFPEDGKARCQDSSCFNRKSAELIVGRFVEVRQRIPGFWIADEKAKMSKESAIKRLVDETLRERGFEFRKIDGDVWSHQTMGVSNFDFSAPALQSFPMEGYSIYFNMAIGPEKADKKTRALPYKNDYMLDRIAQEIVEQKETEKVDAAVEVIDGMTDTDVKQAVQNSSATKFLKLILAYIVSASNADIKSFALEGGMDRRKAADVINTLEPHELRTAIIRFICGDDSDYITADYLEAIFPDAFRDTETIARTKFYNRVRKYWNNYDHEITEDEIDADLAERAERLTKDEQKEEE